MEEYVPDMKKLNDPEFIKMANERFEKREMTAEDRKEFERAVKAGEIVLPPNFDEDNGDDV